MDGGGPSCNNQEAPPPPMPLTPLFIRVIYTDLERQILRGLVQKYEHIVENRIKDKATVKLKNDTWEEIGKEFNASPGVSIREVKSLRKCWENIKNAAKEEFRNGGGRNLGQTPPNSEECQKFYGTLMKDEIGSSLNSYDSDNNNIDSTVIYNHQESNLLHSDTATRGRHHRIREIDTEDDYDEEETSFSSTRKRKIMTNGSFSSFKEEEHNIKMEILRNKRDYERKEHEHKMESLNAEKYYWEEKRKRLDEPE